MSWAVFDDLVRHAERQLAAISDWPVPRPPRRWQRASLGSLRLLRAAIEIVSDGEPDKLAELGEDGLPVAWRIFKSGWNTSRNGPALFDEVAAELVMRDYREHGARVQVDMDHASLNKESKAYDPRGLGYHGLEVREDGSLWACAAAWTERGASCLRVAPGAKAAELPYYSPAFDTDADLEHGDEPDRVTYVHNGGLVGTPATDRPMALAAASRHKGQSMDPKEALKSFRALDSESRDRLVQLWKLTSSQAQLPSAKLIDLLKWQDSAGDDVDPKVLGNMVKQIPGGDPNAGIGGLMRQLRSFMAMAMKALLGEDPGAEAVPTEGEPEPEMALQDHPPPSERQAAQAAARRRDEELRTLRASVAVAETTAAADRKLVKEIRDERAAEHWAIRCNLIGKYVAKGFNAALAWEDPTVDMDERKPKGSLATMPIAELQTWADAPGTNAGLYAPAPVPAGGWTGAATQPGIFQVSQHEMDCLEHRAKRMDRSLEWATRKYRERRTMQCKGAAGNRELLRVLSRPYVLDRNHPEARQSNIVLRDPSGHWTPDDLRGFHAWATQAPIDQFAAVSGAAMREFDLTYNIASATPGPNWAEFIGDIRPSGSLGDVTYPLTFQEFFYEEETAQAPKAETPTLWSVDVRKKPYSVGASASLRHLNDPNSFDHINEDWLRAAEGMATGLWDLMMELAAEILVGKPPGSWPRLYQRFSDGKVEDLTGKDVFDTDHPINPFKLEVKDINGSTKWSNYTSTATPFNASNLTAEKRKFDMTPNARGRFMRMPATHILHPTILGQDVHNAISVQDLILAKVNIGGSDVDGTVRSQHTGQGMLRQEIEHLPGSDPATADWLLFSEERKRAGKVPFVMAMGTTEEVTIYDEGSDYAKKTKHIRQERVVWLKVIPMHPQAVRYVEGS